MGLFPVFFVLLLMPSKGGVKFSVWFFILLTFLAAYTRLQADAAVPAGPLIKQVSSLLKWTRSTSKPLQSEKNVLQFEEGYLVETVVQGNELGVMPYKIIVSPEGELFAVDADKSNIVRITPPLSQYSRARLVAGSFQGYKGHVDGKPSDARFNYPKGVALDDKGNVYVADTSNLAIRKIGESGVTTIAGGKSNAAGYRDGPSEDAKFSTDFDLVYVRSTCSLLVVDRGNAALRQISLNQDDCEHQYSSVSSTDMLMVIGAVLIGYISCVIQHGFGSSLFSKLHGKMDTDSQVNNPMNEKPSLIEPSKENQETGWPSFGQLITDLLKLAFEASGNTLSNLIPFRSRENGPKNGLTPLKDSLIMPEDEPEPEPEPLVHKLRTPAHMLETRREKLTEVKPPKMRSTSFKDPSLSTKHRSSRRHEFAEYYGSGELPPPVRSKSMKEKTKHRQRDGKSGETGFGSSGMESKPIENKGVNYEQTKFDHYNMRSKYGESYRYE